MGHARRILMLDRSVSTGRYLMVPVTPRGGLRHNIQRAYEAPRKRCRAPAAYGPCSLNAILSNAPLRPPEVRPLQARDVHSARRPLPQDSWGSRIERLATSATSCESRSANSATCLRVASGAVGNALTIPTRTACSGPNSSTLLPGHTPHVSCPSSTNGCAS